MWSYISCSLPHGASYFVLLHSKVLLTYVFRSPNRLENPEETETREQSEGRGSEGRQQQ